MKIQVGLQNLCFQAVELSFNNGISPELMVFGSRVWVKCKLYGWYVVKRQMGYAKYKGMGDHHGVNV